MQDKQNRNPEKKLFLSRSIFEPVFRDLSESEYCEYSRASRNIVRFTTGMIALQKTADHLRTGAGIS